MSAKRWAGIINPDGTSCRLCGCTEDAACEGGCAWVDAGDMTDVCSRCAFLKPGQPVWYYPDTGSRRAFAAVIAGEPRKLGDEWVVRLEGLGPKYGEACHGGKERTSVPSADRLALRPRAAVHETMRQLLIWATEVEAELELEGRVSGATREQLRCAIARAGVALIPTREDCA